MTQGPGDVWSRTRATAVPAVVAVGAAVASLALPWGGAESGVPAAAVVDGIALGFVYALVAVSLVLVRRVTGVVNFAQTAIGVVAAELSFRLILVAGVPFAVALPVGLLVAAGVAVLVSEAVVTPLRTRGGIAATVATVAVAVATGALARTLVGLLPMPARAIDVAELAAAILAGQGSLPLPGSGATIAGVAVDPAQVLTAVTAVVLFAALAAGLRWTTLGQAVRVLAAVGPDTRLIADRVVAVRAVWVVAACLSGVALTALGALSTPAAIEGFAPGVLLVGSAAAVIARWRSLPLAAGGAIGLGVMQAALTHRHPGRPSVWLAVVLVVVVAALASDRRAGERTADAWPLTREPRQVPEVLSRVASVRGTRAALIAVGLLAVALYPWMVSTRAIVVGGVISVFAIVALSIVVVTGWSGQVSLGQFGLAAVGAMVGGALTANVGLSFWLAVPFAVAVTGLVGAGLGLIAARLGGVAFAVATLAFGVAGPAVLFDEKTFGWLRPRGVDRPGFLLIDFEDERSMYYLCVAAFVLATVALVNLRRSSTGRWIIASRENPRDVASLASSVFRARIVAAAISGGVAGFAGVVFVHLQRGIAVESFAFARSVDVLLFAVVGGVTSIGGVLVGSILFNLREFFFGDTLGAAALAPVAALVLLHLEAGGLVGVLQRGRDSALRIVAQRRQLVVPGLFGDTDVEASGERVYPLAPPLPAAGLAVIPADHRFRLASQVLRPLGPRSTGPRASRSRTEERQLIHAAAEAARVTEAGV